ncbi:hypothetical protein [Cohnella fermenti]|uniref:Uncharacterized protein n=1 Tax=Cohnella fermenti TaxID=2565925 RepID=A0A4S4C0U4_9BACL|nr:hypothetical protein [Cohnella fermenti]THF81242.1 hypothetical protein E6C55_09010 [Cohnella fermenti]
MALSWRFVLGFGGFGALLTFLFSIGSNPPGTTIIRSFYAFAAFLALALVLRIVLSVLLRPAALPQEESEEARGAHLDLATPSDDAELTDLMKGQWSGEQAPVAGFQPLQPARFVSIDNANDERMVQAVRQMKDE